MYDFKTFHIECDHIVNEQFYSVYELFGRMLKSNGLNSISKYALRDEDCLWLINCTTQEYLVNVGQNSHFNMPPHVWHDHQHVDKQ